MAKTLVLAEKPSVGKELCPAYWDAGVGERAVWRGNGIS